MMKKLWMVLLLIVCMLASSFAFADELEEDNDLYVLLDAYNGYSDAMLHLTVTEDSMFTEETGGIELIANPGDTIGQMLASYGIIGVEPALEGDAFEGWMPFEIIITTDEFGFDETELVIEENVTLLSTEELMNVVIPDHNVNYVAKWASIPVEDYFTMNAWEDATSTGSFTLDANGGMMTFQEEESYESAYYTYWLEDGQTLADAMTNPDSGWAALISVTKEGAEQFGWTLYEADSIFWSEEAVEDEEGIICIPMDFGGEAPIYLLLVNGAAYGKSFSTEELLAVPCVGKSYYAVANWD